MYGKGSIQAATIGQVGSTFINDTATYTGGWGIIYCISAVVFDTLTSGNRPDGTAVMLGTINQITMSPGMQIYGYFTVIKLTSGSVIAYEV